MSLPPVAGRVLERASPCQREPAGAAARKAARQVGALSSPPTVGRPLLCRVSGGAALARRRGVAWGRGRRPALHVESPRFDPCRLRTKLGKAPPWLLQASVAEGPGWVLSGWRPLSTAKFAALWPAQRREAPSSLPRAAEPWLCWGGGRWRAEKVLSPSSHTACSQNAVRQKPQLQKVRRSHKGCC